MHLSVAVKFYRLSLIEENIFSEASNIFLRLIKIVSIFRVNNSLIMRYLL